jgi:hypothetical protein
MSTVKMIDVYFCTFCRKSGAKCVYLGLEEKTASFTTSVTNGQGPQEGTPFGDLPSDCLVVSIPLDGLSLKLSPHDKTEFEDQSVSVELNRDPICSSAESSSSSGLTVCRINVDSENFQDTESLSAYWEQVDGSKSRDTKFVQLDSSPALASGNKTEIETSNIDKHRQRIQVKNKERLAKAGYQNVSLRSKVCTSSGEFLFGNDDIASDTDSSNEDSTETVKVAERTITRGSSGLLLGMVKEQSKFADSMGDPLLQQSIKHCLSVVEKSDSTGKQYGILVETSKATEQPLKFSSYITSKSVIQCRDRSCPRV